MTLARKLLLWKITKKIRKIIIGVYPSFNYFNFYYFSNKEKLIYVCRTIDQCLLFKSLIVFLIKEKFIYYIKAKFDFSMYYDKMHFSDKVIILAIKVSKWQTFLCLMMPFLILSWMTILIIQKYAKDSFTI